MKLPGQALRSDCFLHYGTQRRPYVVVKQLHTQSGIRLISQANDNEAIMLAACVLKINKKIGCECYVVKFIL